MTDEPRNRWTLLFAVLIGIAVVGFIRGTSDSDYVLEPPLRHFEDHADGGDVPPALTYAEKRGQRPGLEDAARSCQDCHDDRRSVVGAGRHVEHPVGVRVPAGAQLEKLSAAGGRLETDEQGNQVVGCRSCHRPHNAEIDPRLVLPTRELCATCHGARHGEGVHPVEGQIEGELARAVARIGGKPADGLSCTTCHAAHEASWGPLLRTAKGGRAACASCHQAKAGRLAGEGHGGKFCQDCHGMHEPPTHVGRGPAAAVAADQPCVNCHQDGGGDLQIDSAIGHLAWSSKTSCGDCHDPHGTGRGLPAKASVEQVCVGCHEDQATVRGTKHDAAVRGGASGEACLSCHDIHGTTELAARPAGVNPATAACLSCHDGKGDARRPKHLGHPDGLLLTGEGLPFRYDGAIPYFGPDGERTANKAAGEITCQTCHDAHTWRHDAADAPGDVEGTEQDSFLRDPDEIVKFCTVCHGVDGRPRFRFFHEDRFRQP